MNNPAPPLADAYEERRAADIIATVVGALVTRAGGSIMVTDEEILAAVLPVRVTELREGGVRLESGPQVTEEAEQARAATPVEAPTMDEPDRQPPADPVPVPSANEDDIPAGPIYSDEQEAPGE